MSVLTRADKDSGAWLKVEEHLKDRLEALRRQNDAPSLNDKDTAVIRGRIAEVKKTLELGSPDTDFGQSAAGAEYATP